MILTSVVLYVFSLIIALYIVSVTPELKFGKNVFTLAFFSSWILSALILYVSPEFTIFCFATSIPLQLYIAKDTFNDRFLKRI